MRAQLGHHAALAHARLADDGHQADRRFAAGRLEQPRELGQLVAPTDVRGGMRAGEIHAGARRRADGMEDPDRLVLALERGRLELAVLDGATRGLIGGQAHRHAHLRRRGLDAGGGVDGVPGQETLPGAGVDAHAGQHLAGVDADAQAERRARQPRQISGLGADVQARAHGAQRVVLVRGGDAEDADHRIADELLDHAAVPLDLAARHGCVAGQHAVHVFGIGRLGRGGEADQVAEQRGNDPAFLGGCPAGFVGQRQTADRAEAESVRALGAASSACDHGRKRSEVGKPYAGLCSTAWLN